MLRWMVIGATQAVLFFRAGAVDAQQPRVSDEIAGAVFALPESQRAEATVLGYRDGEWVVVREGSNEFHCLADVPGDDRFRVSCYHRSLEPFMARGRALRALGKGRDDVRRIRRAEVEAGALTLPERASMISLFGRINPQTGRPDSVSVLRVIYLPWATAESTGLPTRDQATRGEPFLMDPGKHRAHLMIPGGWRAFPKR